MIWLIPPPGALRLILACLVVISHYAFLSGHPLHVGIDGPAVIGFFFFSGYWITRLWRDKYSRCQSPLLTFYLSRGWRIYPLAILGTLAMAAVAPTDIATLLWNLALFGLQFGFALNPPAWSLATELQFYAVAPLLILLLTNRAAFALMSVAGLLTWTAFALGWIGTWFPTFMLPFVLGVYYAHNPNGKLMLRLAPWSLSVFVVFGVLPNILALPVALDAVSRFVVMVLSLFSLPFIAASLTQKSGGIDRELGNLAYPVYLFHWPVFVGIAKFVPDYRIAAVATLAISVAVLWLVDRPLERWRQHWVARRSTGATASAAAEPADSRSTSSC